LLQCPVSQLEIPATFLKDSSGIAEMVIYHLPCHQRHPPDCQEKILLGTNGQLDPEGDLSSWQVGVKASDAPQNLVKLRNQLGSTTHKIDKNLGSNSGLPRRQKGRLITSQRLLVTTDWGEAVSLRFRGQGRSSVLCKCV
jgi:hypothetical protein